MKSKNLTKADLDHMGRVKSLCCGVCNAPPPSIAHHIVQGLHYLTIPVCESCHVSPHNGIHHMQNIWRVMKKTEMTVLNDTIRLLATTPPPNRK